jgi:hypothetical protein
VIITWSNEKDWSIWTLVSYLNLIPIFNNISLLWFLIWYHTIIKRPFNTTKYQMGEWYYDARYIQLKQWSTCPHQSPWNINCRIVLSAVQVCPMTVTTIRYPSKFPDSRHPVSWPNMLCQRIQILWQITQGLKELIV